MERHLTRKLRRKYGKSVDTILENEIAINRLIRLLLTLTEDNPELRSALVDGRFDVTVGAGVQLHGALTVEVPSIKQQRAGFARLNLEMHLTGDDITTFISITGPKRIEE